MSDRRVWMFATLVALAFLYYEIQTNRLLRENIALRIRVNEVERTYCLGVHRVNDLCERVVVDLMQRIGVVPDAAPVLTHAVWKRATHAVGGGEEK